MSKKKYENIKEEMKAKEKRRGKAWRKEKRNIPAETISKPRRERKIFSRGNHQ